MKDDASKFLQLVLKFDFEGLWTRLRSGAAEDLEFWRSAREEHLMELTLIGDDDCQWAHAIDLGGGVVEFSNLQPGSYRLVTETGWELFSRELSERDLLEENDAPLRLAAASKEFLEPGATFFESIAGGDAELFVVPGHAAGRIVVRTI